MKTTKFKIEHIQLFDYYDHCQTTDDENFGLEYSYSANLAINNEFVMQISSTGEVDIPYSVDCFWGDKDKQDYACENIDVDEVIKQTGFINDRNWLIEHGAELINPENAPKN